MYRSDYIGIKTSTALHYGLCHTFLSPFSYQIRWKVTENETMQNIRNSHHRTGCRNIKSHPKKYETKEKNMQEFEAKAQKTTKTAFRPIEIFSGKHVWEEEKEKKKHKLCLFFSLSLRVSFWDFVSKKEKIWEFRFLYDMTWECFHFVQRFKVCLKTNEEEIEEGEKVYLLRNIFDSTSIVWGSWSYVMDLQCF